MKKQKPFAPAVGFLLAFVLWTLLSAWADVQPIGPKETSVGLATLNRFFHGVTGVHLLLYTLTDWLSLIPLGFVSAFALLGLCQWIGRKSLCKVDADLLLLGGFYLVASAVYLFFETAAIHFRPVLIEGRLEASYPSSTTVLVICVMATAVRFLRPRIRNPRVKGAITAVMTAFSPFMVIARLLSGVHWLSDIVGGLLLSAGVVFLYTALCQWRK